MESSDGNPVGAVASIAGGGSSRRYGVYFSASNFIQAPLSALLEYSGILRPISSHTDGETPSIVPAVPSAGEVSIRNIGTADQEGARLLARDGEGNGAPADEEREY